MLLSKAASPSTNGLPGPVSAMTAGTMQSAVRFHVVHDDRNTAAPIAAKTLHRLPISG